MSVSDDEGARVAASEHVDVAALLQVLPDAAVHADLATRTMIDVNAAFEDMTGYGREDLRGASLTLLLPDGAIQGIAVKPWATLLGAPVFTKRCPCVGVTAAASWARLAFRCCKDLVGRSSSFAIRLCAASSSGS